MSEEKWITEEEWKEAGYQLTEELQMRFFGRVYDDDFEWVGYSYDGGRWI